MKKWQLQEAKNKFSQVAEEAADYGPQLVTKHGKEAVVILSIEEYRQLVKKTDSLTDFLCRSPLADTELDVTRDGSAGREVTL